jgi:GMP synthase-like glutamine amidotransferase
VGGSKHGVYEDIDWIKPLEQFLRDAVTAAIPVVGICFGHQILAQAFGGTVVKADVGWGIGAAQFALTQRPDWAAPLGDGFTNYVAHQDQITALPDGATAFASAAYCPYAAAYYGTSEAPSALTVQAHPEFDVTFLEDLIDLRAGESFSHETAAAARTSLAQPNSNAAWAQVLAGFFTAAHRRRQ